MRDSYIQTESTVRHTKCGRMRGMVVGEGGRSKGLYCIIMSISTEQVKQLGHMHCT